jgi:hypothetical protein
MVRSTTRLRKCVGESRTLVLTWSVNWGVALCGNPAFYSSVALFFSSKGSLTRFAFALHVALGGTAVANQDHSAGIG